MLNERDAKNAVTKEKSYRIPDGLNGLFLEIRPSGKKVWLIRYSFEGKTRTQTLDEYPDLSVKEARDMAHNIRREAKQGNDPKQGRKPKRGTTFREIANEWLAEQLKNGGYDKKYHTTVGGRLNNHILPFLGDMGIADIKSKDFLELAQYLRDCGHVETARRCIAICGQVMRYGALLGLVDNDPTYALRGYLPSGQGKHFASIQEVGKLRMFYQAIDDYTGSRTIQNALRYLVLNFPRPTELRHLEWSEINLDERVIRIEAEKMKMKRPHIIPFSEQTYSIFMAQQAISGNGQYVFPAPRSYTGSKPMSDAALTVAMRYMGYEQSEVCAHGFRHTASTMLNDCGMWSADAIERQLAHVEQNKIRGTYNAAEYLDERRKMLQYWSDFVTQNQIRLS